MIRASLRRDGERFALAFLFILMSVVFSVMEPDTFATTASWQIILRSQSVLGVAALALMIPLVAGNLDLSVGSTLGLSAIATAAGMSRFDAPLWIAAPVGVALGCAVGGVNGALVGWFNISSIIATLGTATIIGGVVTWYTNGLSITGHISGALSDLGTKNVLGLPRLIVALAIVCFATWFLLERTVFGRRLFAIGANRDAAPLVGIDVRRMTFVSFVLAGGLAGLGGVLDVAQQGNGNPQVVGVASILPALAAVFLGVTTFRPGVFNVPGAMLGLFFVAAGVSGLTFAGAQPWVQDVFDGATLVVAVGISSALRARASRPPRARTSAPSEQRAA